MFNTARKAQASVHVVRIRMDANINPEIKAFEMIFLKKGSACKMAFPIHLTG
jgi:hypothetical protein